MIVMPADNFKPQQLTQACKDSSVFLIYLLSFAVWEPIFLLLSDWWLVDKGRMSQGPSLLCLSVSLSQTLSRSPRRLLSDKALARLNLM